MTGKLVIIGGAEDQERRVFILRLCFPFPEKLIRGW